MPIVPAGGLVLVTGANGYVAGVTIQKLLDAGFKVRGTVRSIEKNNWMLDHYGSNFTLVEVPELSADGALDEAVKGVDGIANVASSVAFNPDPDAFIPPVIKGAINVLEAAAKEPSVKSVVYTSSQAACIHLEPGKPYSITPETYNEGCLNAAWTWEDKDDKSMTRMLVNYECAKTASEKNSFEWVEKNKPHFTFNSVVPNVNFGTMVSLENTGFPSSSSLLKMIWEGNTMPAFMIPPEWYVDVEDTALLHIAALTQPDVQNERVLAFGGRFNYNEILDLFRKLVPDRAFLKDIDEPPSDQGTVDNSRGTELLKRLGKPGGFSTLEEAITKWVPFILKSENMDLPETAADRLRKSLEEKT
ncbi:NAD dependent epimerase/dehydratase family protein [Lindgomyces ingoldianus]|uniref:NAD dependent epimerase/dehydratase family protein n=1 Tax=Lindgomyces ingoldianus TaxID=673940 RepID=A0ACB6R7A5_9PLEO|nr:NAD dependent epimerase/dehydratase family protein [Lindgomyces ingoldianus]KAF2475134.1 NAD dependent epimerase/dehydratase family protein [Lindgomyces ingoldianus]